MSVALRATPNRLVALTCFGSVLSCVGFFAVSKWHDSLSQMLADAALVLVGLCLLYGTPFQLREGIANERWPANETEPLRRLVKHPAWTAATFLLVAAMLVSLLLDRHHHRLSFWPIFLLLQMMTQLTSSFRAPYQRPGAPMPLDWTSVKPLHSEHWGER